MNRVIILEGPDGGGKTTLADSLVQNYGFRKEHEGVPNPKWDSGDLFRHYVSTLWKALLRRDQPVVFDRHYLGETIYGPVMRGRSLITPTQKRLIERLVRARDVRVVVVLPPRAVALDNWKAKREDYVDQEEWWHHIYSCYDALGYPCTAYDYTLPNHLNLFAPRGELPMDVVGSPKAELLLVGEQINKRATSTDWAFFAETNSSGFLNMALEPLPEKNLAFVNALTPGDQRKNLDAIVRRLPNFKAAVALGRVAAQALQDQGIHHHQLPHPSNVRRFNGNSKLETYSQLFQKILANPGDKVCVTKL